MLDVLDVAYDIACKYWFEIEYEYCTCECERNVNPIVNPNLQLKEKQCTFCPLSHKQK